MANITSATNYFPRASEPVVTMQLTNSIASGATTVPVTNINTQYSVGDVVVLTINPSGTNKQVFTGIVGTNNVGSVVWTEGTNSSHTNGEAIVDYVTATHLDLISAGAKVAHNSDGSLKASAINAALGVTSTPPADWTLLPTTPTVTSSNGQKEYVLGYAGVNYTDRLQKGSKLMVPRSVAPPTQAMSFSSASSQYASKTSPTGITFTNNFTCEAWVYLTSYPAAASNGASIISRLGASSGFQLVITSVGQLSINGYNGGYQNVRGVGSQQSVPLNQWVHVAGTLDMSGFTTATCSIYINGVSVPIAFSTGGTNPTAFVQQGDLNISSFNGSTGAAYLNGYVSEVRVWSTLRTAQQIRDNMGISLTGSETNLVALFQGNGNFNDKTSNANNLTANGGAVATQAANPYSATEYAIVTNVAFTGGNTAATVFSGQNVIPNATLGSTSYSGQRAPFGFPAARSNWMVDSLYTGFQEIGYGAFSQDTGSNSFLTVPTGAWRLVVHTNAETHSTTAGQQDQSFGVRGSVQSNILSLMALRIYSPGGVNTNFLTSPWDKEQFITLAASDTFQLYGRLAQGSGSITFLLHSSGGAMRAECAYL